MNRRLVAAVWIAGATIPLLAVTLFVVGCCALPFHGAMHKVMPVCQIALNAFRIDPSTPEQRDTPPAMPAPEKQEPVKIAATRTLRPLALSPQPVLSTPVSPAAYRSFITLGALRCDRDVGLHLLVDTFRI